MTDNLRHVRRGDALRIGATTWNAFVDAARANRQRADTGARLPRSTRAGMWALNDTADALPIGAVVGVDSVLFDPADVERAFLFQPGVRVKAPDWTKHQAYGVMVEPAAAGKLGRIALDGVVPCKVALQRAGDQYASAVDDTTGGMVSRSIGDARIIWHPGTLNDPEWALIRLLGHTRCYAQLTVATPIASTTHRWQYAWKEVAWTGAGQFSDVSGGRTNTNSGLAYNTMEAFNAATGIQGSGEDMSLLAGSDFEPVAIGAGAQGAVVQLTQVGAGSNRGWVMTATNITTGSCPEETP